MTYPEVDNPELRAFYTRVFTGFKQVVSGQTEEQRILNELGNLSGTSISFLSHRVSRRSALRTTGLAAIGLMFATTLLPRVAQAEDEWIDLGPDPEERNQREYFPYDKAVARNKGYVRLSDLGGSLDIHDEVLGHHGPRGHAREWQEDFENLSLRAEPTRRSWMGDCHAVANVMAYHIQLIEEILRGKSFLYEGLEINKTIVIGLNAAKHAHDAMVAFRNEPAFFRALLTVAAKRGDAPVAQIIGPEGGIWNYKVTRATADLETVELHNFGQVIQVPTDTLAGMYFPRFYNPNDQVSVTSINLEAKKRTAGHFNSELNHIIVDSITQNQPLD